MLIEGDGDEFWLAGPGGISLHSFGSAGEGPEGEIPLDAAALARLVPEGADDGVEGASAALVGAGLASTATSTVTGWSQYVDLHEDQQRIALVHASANYASAAVMAAALEEAWPEVPMQGLVVTRYGHAVPTARIEVIEASHPVPDAAGKRPRRDAAAAGAGPGCGGGGGLRAGMAGRGSQGPGGSGSGVLSPPSHGEGGGA